MTLHESRALYTPHPSWARLPGTPEPFFLDAGDGERSVVGTDLITVLLSGDETEGQFGCFTLEGSAGDPIPAHSHSDVHETFYVLDGEVQLWLDDEKGKRAKKLLTAGDFAYVPANVVHSYQIRSERAKIMGTATGGFERFFHAAGLPTGQRGGLPDEPHFPTMEQFIEAGRHYGNTFRPDADLDF
ncbi:quercetin 2,3-dioxygenase [Streptomyces sp. NPDC003011]